MPLSNERYEELTRTIDPLRESNSYGIDILLEVLAFIWTAFAQSFWGFVVHIKSKKFQVKINEKRVMWNHGFLPQRVANMKYFCFQIVNIAQESK